MSSHAYATPLRLEPRPTRVPQALVLVSHLGALLLVSLTPLAWVFQGGLAALIGASLVREWRRLARYPVSLVWLSDRWLLEFRDGLMVEAELLPSTFYTRYLVILNLRQRAGGGRGRYSVALFPGSVDPNVLRQLRVRLRLHRQAVVDPAVP